MTSRLDWRAIGLLTAAMACALALWIALTMTRTDRAEATADPDATPLDYADRGLRSALDDYNQFTLGRGLDPIAPACDRDSPAGGERYRFVSLPGMSDEPFAAITVVVGGGSVGRVEQRVFAPEQRGSGEHAWRVSYQRPLAIGEIDTLRERANRWLLSGKSASSGAHSVDVSEWYFEMCRRGRYHFAARYGAKSEGEKNAELIAFGETMRALVEKRSGEP